MATTKTKSHKINKVEIKEQANITERNRSKMHHIFVLLSILELVFPFQQMQKINSATYREMNIEKHNQNYNKRLGRELKTLKKSQEKNHTLKCANICLHTLTG